MESRIAPAKLFYPLALVVFGAIFLFPSPLLPWTAFYTLLVGAIWSFVVQNLQIENPRLAEMAPPIFLLLFMGILTQALGRTTTETLFHTVRGLVMFRTLIFILIKIRVSAHPVSRTMMILVAGIALEMFFVGARVYHLIYPAHPLPSFLPYVEMKSLAVVVAGLMLHGYLQKSRR